MVKELKEDVEKIKKMMYKQNEYNNRDREPKQKEKDILELKSTTEM